jgi:L-malate glycosyltransferase
LHDPPRLVYVGRLHEQKGLDVLLTALAAVQSSPSPALSLVGTGPFEERLRALVYELGISGDVEFAGVRQSLTPLLHGADVFVLPSRAEGLSNSLLEAMAIGLPVVASAIPGNTDVIQSGVNGLLSDPGDPAALADALERLLSDGGLRRRLGEAARRTVEERFALEEVAARYRELYEELSATKEAVST